MASALPSGTDPRAAWYGARAARTVGDSIVSCRLDRDASPWTGAPALAASFAWVFDTLFQSAACDASPGLYAARFRSLVARFEYDELKYFADSSPRVSHR